MFCERNEHPQGEQAIEMPDSASAVAAARRALGTRASGAEIGTVTQTREGVFIQFVQSNIEVLDGTASVYVSPGPCVIYLGW